MTNLNAFAQKLMRVNEQVSRTNTPRAIFGSIGDLPLTQARSKPYRIGMWPCISTSEPVTAMGLFAILAHLLERWQDIEVYRLFVRLDGDPAQFDWEIEQSQFTVEEWDVEALDENIGIWGTLTTIDEQWTLAIEIDHDLLVGSDEDVLEMAISAATPAALVTQLPAFATQIAEIIGADRLDAADPVYDTDVEPVFDDAFKRLMQAALVWDVRLIAMLWDADWEDEEIEAAADELIEAGADVDAAFAAWIVAKALAHTMRPGYSFVGDLSAEYVQDTVEAFPDSFLVVPILADGLFRLVYTQQAYSLLEAEVAKHPDNTVAWLNLAQLLAGSRRVVESIKRFQTAIERGAVSSDLYRAYGNIMQVAERYGEPVESFALITPENEGDDIILEAIAAYSKALELDKDDVAALYSRLLQHSELLGHETEMWQDFESLLDRDHTGEYIRDVIDHFYDLEDASTGIAAIETRIAQYPDRVDLYVNLAALHLVFYDGVAALPYLEKAESMVDDQIAKADIERLKLAANDPEFEQRFAEIGAILDAGNGLGADDATYLEGVVENAPHVIEAYLSLGRAYYLWGDKEEALDVLLDAQKNMPDIPAVIEWIARILWESEAKDIAFQYLNQGMQANPFNVALLAQAGRYLFDNEQLEDARKLLSRAEEISPRDPSLGDVRSYIARRMREDPERYGESE